MLATIRFRAFCLVVCCQKNVKIRIYKTMILSVVLYGCETLSLTLREKHTLRVFENFRELLIFGEILTAVPVKGRDIRRKLRSIQNV
jgi:hypothetical protein